MTMYYSPSTGGFYDPRLHDAAIPADAVAITGADYLALLQAQEMGMLICPGPTGDPQSVAPAQPTPAEALAAERAAMRCSRFQARAALHGAGLLTQVEAAVAAADPIVQIAWADAAEWQRSSPTLAALAAAIGLTDAQVDDLFRAAMQIVA